MGVIVLMYSELTDRSELTGGGGLTEGWLG